MKKSIRIKDYGPVKLLDEELPAGGFAILTGTSGVGKTTTINAVEALIRGGDLGMSKRDGADEAFVQGFGAWISVKKSQRRSGKAQLEVDSLAGKFALADLVDPGIKDPLAADAHRVKALVQLAGVEPDLRLFHRVLGGSAEFSEVVGDELASADLVSMAKKVKAAIDAAALKQEKAAQKAKSDAAASRQLAGENATGPEPRSVDELNAELEEAIRDEAKLKADRESGEAAKRRSDEALKMLEVAKMAYTGLSVEDAESEVNKKNRVYNEALEALAVAKKAVEDADAECKLAWAVQKEAENHAKNMAAWRRSVEDSANISIPSPEEIDAAAKDVLHCRREIERAIAFREARAQIERASMHDDLAKSATEAAERLRKSADNVDGVLSDAVGRLNTPLRVKNGRLVLTTDRGDEKFAELSDGERWALAFDIAIPLIPGNGLLTMPQAAFGELPPAVRQSLHEKLCEMGVVCLTAQATDEPEMAVKPFDAFASNEELSA